MATGTKSQATPTDDPGSCWYWAQVSLILARQQKINLSALRYKIGDEIGDGNFAKVYKCRMANTQSEFAMKVIKKEIMKGKVSFV